MYHDRNTWGFNQADRFFKNNQDAFKRRFLDKYLLFYSENKYENIIDEFNKTLTY